MSEKIVVSREMDFRRGGAKGNQAAPVWTIYGKNTSGGSVARGDIVVWDTTNSTPDLICFTTTTTGSDTLVLGMVFDYSIGTNGYGRVQIWGPTDALKVDGTTDIAKGTLIGTFTTAKIGAKTTGVGAFAIAQEAYATNNSSGVIDAFICNTHILRAAMDTHAHADSGTGGNLGDTTVDTALTLGDAVPLNLGASDDVVIQWDATDMHIDPAADDSVMNIGNGTESFDVKVFGNTTALFAYWDASASTLGLADAVKLGLGGSAATPDVSVNWDGTDLEIAAAADDSVINFGDGTASFDIKVFGNDTDHFVTFDAGANTLFLSDKESLGFGNTAAAPDVTINWDATQLQIGAAAANALVIFGGANQMDLQLIGNTTDDFAYWDGSANTLGFTDGEMVGFGNTAAAPDVSITWDGTQLQIAGAAANSAVYFGGANQLDLFLIGNTTDDFAQWDGSANTLGFTDGEKVGFGNTAAAPDVSVNWDGTQLQVLAAADDELVILGDGTASFDVKLFGETTDLYAYWDASASALGLVDATKLGFGNTAAAPDVSVNWDGTQLQVLAAADDEAIILGNGTNSFDVKVFGNTTDDFALFDASANNLDLAGGFDLRVTNIGTLDFPSQVAGNKTFTVTGLTSNDVVILSPREGTQGALIVDKVAADQLTIRNTASESSNVECNYYVLAKVT